MELATVAWSAVDEADVEKSSSSRQVFLEAPSSGPVAARKIRRSRACSLLGATSEREVANYASLRRNKFSSGLSRRE